MQQLAALQGDVKHYDWGGTQYIPTLLKIENPTQQPFAEYWMGAHPQAKCLLSLKDGEQVLLKDFIEQNKKKTLGKTVLEKFGALPYLLKVLDVKDMLSIQVHPSKKQAAIDFEKENKKGIPLHAPERNYKDCNHKPELMVAMSEFYLLHGFKPEAELKAILKSIPELKIFAAAFKKNGYSGLYKMAMELPQETVNEILQPLLNRIIPLYNNNKLQKNNEDFWAARAALTFNQHGIIDRGIFSIYFFNLLHLQPGEAIFQNAGVPHAYLHGQNVEIMASSDNVLRGGLTTKHIDTVELLKHTKCEATEAKIMSAPKKEKKVYKTIAKDFELSAYKLKAGDKQQLEPQSTEILLLMKGAAELACGNYKIRLKRGSIAAVAFPGKEIIAKAESDTLLFSARVPV